MAVIASSVGSYLPNNCSFELKPTHCPYPQSDLRFDSYYENYPSHPPPLAYQPYAVADTGYRTSVDVNTLRTSQIPSGETSQGGLELYYPHNRAKPGPFSGNEVSSYHSTDKGEQALYYFGEEEKLARRGSPTDQSHRKHQPFEVAMGSGSSILTTTGSKKLSRKQQLKNGRDSACSSDNGGFESGTPKPVLGVKDKLRYSFDKISLKSPFKWNSSDKLTRSNSSGSSKSKSKNNRRFSDSNTSLLTVDSSKDKKALRKKKSPTEHITRRKENSSTTQRKVRTLSTGISESEFQFDQKIFTSNTHDYVNLASGNNRLINTQPQVLQNNSMGYAQDNVFDSYNGRGTNEYCVMQNSRTYQDTSALPYHQMWDNKDTVTRAKGTWKMLKTSKPKQLPVKAGSYPVYTSFLSDSYDAMRNEGSASNNVIETVFPDESRRKEPPKLAPVSGKLLLDKKSNNTILRPTAFRPVASSPPTQTSSTSHSPESKTLEVANIESPPHDVHSGLGKSATSISSESNISDSGRHSATSIPAAVTTNGNFSYSGSEGYESARISSSTTQSAMQEPEYNIDSTPFSPIKTDDVKITDLETRVKEKQAQVQSMRRNMKDNEKALHDIVHEDNDCTSGSDVAEINRKQTGQLKSQSRKVSMESQQNAEQQYRVMHEEQKQLLDTNNELEGRIKSMTDAIDDQSRHSEHVANLRARLEESEMEIQQKHGEIFLLKRQVKERQTDLTQRFSEAVALKSYNRDLCAKLTQRDSQAAALQACLNKRDQEIAELERRLAAGTSRVSTSIAESLGATAFRNNSFNGAINTIEDEDENAHEVASFSDAVCDDHSYLTPSSSLVFSDEGQPDAFSLEEREGLLKRLHAAELRCVAQEKRFEQEKQQWAEDKLRVIKYQKQLQGNYIQMYKRSHALEREVKILTSRLRAVGVNAAVGRRVNENYSGARDLSYPMEI